jgi:hypothetical protein
MVEVLATDEFTAWFNGLTVKEQEAMVYTIELLRQLGSTLEHPHSSAIAGATFALRELRTQAGGRPLRTFYAFDAKRRAVLLVAGDKTGDDRFYPRMVREATKLWTAYQARLAEEIAAEQAAKAVKRGRKK